MKNFKNKIFIFVIEAICMIMELCASRVLSPYFGSTYLVWTCIIGIILLSSSIGNYLGGKIADNEKISIARITLIASFLIFYIIPASPILLLALSNIKNIKVGAILGTVLLFLPSSLFFGMIPPIIYKKELGENNNGKIIGKISAIATIGGIFGTFIGGFVLIQYFGTTLILAMCAIVTAVLAIFIGLEKKSNVVLLIFLSVVISFYLYTEQNKTKDAILNNEIDAVLTLDTKYDHILITNVIDEDGNIVREMNIGRHIATGNYAEEKLKYELVKNYTRFYDLMFDCNDNIQNTLMIGGGGFGYPKYFVSHYGINMDVIEIDEQKIELAKKYFYLDDCLKDYPELLNIICDDGKIFIANTDKKYDIICNDAFANNEPVKSLTTIESVKQIKNILKEDGAFLSNIIGAAVGENGKFLQAEVKTLKQVFKNVYVIPTENDNTLMSQNYMVIATDKNLNLENCVDIDIANAIILTDDYAPIETLVND